MNVYTLKEFRKLVKDADIIYSSVSLNASTRVPVRVRKKTLLTALDNMDPTEGFSVFADMAINHKGNKVVRLV